MQHRLQLQEVIQMKRIMMEKYGFVRRPDLDFTDDGSKFTCYSVGKLEVSKCVYRGEAFISAHADRNGKLPFDIYSTLPHYDKLDLLNGINVDSLTDADLIRLYQDCLCYEQEYEAAIAAFVFPTVDELNEKAQQIVRHAEQELLAVTSRIAESPDLLLAMYGGPTSSKFHRFMDYWKALKNNVAMASAAGQWNETNSKTAFANTYLKKPIKDSFVYTECMKILDECKA